MNEEYENIPEDVQDAIYEQEMKRQKAITSIFTSIAGLISVVSLLGLSFGIVFLFQLAFGE